MHIISQYIGNKNKKSASQAASQLLLVSIIISVVTAILILIFRWPLLRFLFGKTESDVMNVCEIYLVITTLSLLALVIYDAGASLCSSIGKTNVTMYIFAGIHFCFTGYFCAYGKSYIGFSHNILAIILVRVPGSYYASKYFPNTLFPMGLAAPAGSLLSVIICLIAYRWVKHSVLLKCEGEILSKE